jgi:hypothetical protein
MASNDNPNNNLYKGNVSEQFLIDNIYQLSLKQILSTQKLTAHFCAQYILNDEYQTTTEERNITIDDVLLNQPHLSEQEIINAL